MVRIKLQPKLSELAQKQTNKKNLDNYNGIRFATITRNKLVNLPQMARSDFNMIEDTTHIIRTCKTQ